MTVFQTSRAIPATREAIFAAISDPQRLARWWGPDGFTNTFTCCEFKPGGRWSFVMHGPDGTNYPNEVQFEVIDAPHRVVVRHVSQPHFRLTITLASSPGGSIVSWAQEFEDAQVARRLAPIVVPANEQNLARLSAQVLDGDKPA